MRQRTGGSSSRSARVMSSGSIWSREAAQLWRTMRSRNCAWRLGGSLSQASRIETNSVPPPTFGKVRDDSTEASAGVFL
jgi:hypothetical protein